MDKRNRNIGLSTAAAAMIALLIWQDRMVDGQRETIFFHEKNIESLQSQLKTEIAHTTELRRENELLRVENGGLRDSIFWLDNRVKELEDKLQFYENRSQACVQKLPKKINF